MTAEVITVGPRDSLATARALMSRRRIHHLPVLTRQRLVGIVTDRDLRSAPASAKVVADIMSKEVISIAVNSYVDHAAQRLRRHRIGALPVLDKQRLVGILTSSDVLDAFIAVSGISRPTYELVLTGVQTASALERVREIVQQRRSEVKWMHRERQHASRVHLRLKTGHLDEIKDTLEAAGFTVTSVVATATR